MFTRQWFGERFVVTNRYQQSGNKMSRFVFFREDLPGRISVRMGTLENASLGE
jgi:hypothetical protein